MRIYKIHRKHGHIGQQEIGFFSYILGYLGHIAYSKSTECKYYVDMTNQDIFYCQPGGVNGIVNTWEYFFKNECLLADVNNSENEIFECCGLYNGPLVYSNQPKKIIINNSLLEEYRWVPHVLENQVQFNDDTLIKIKQHRESYLGDNKTIGVHVRYNRDLFVTHQIKCPSIQDYISKTEELRKIHNIDNVFVMSDTNEVINEFKKTFGTSVKFTDSYRRDANTNMYDYGHGRPNHRYLSGYEILMDTLLLSKCEVMLGLCSNVYDMAIYWSEAFNKEKRLNVEYMF